ncbi:MFS transporter [Spirosoma soli]|uniref:MFS transporter n=1 Tax=Spirosoma soli TaxID=1770529 RepID=A0ABW5LZW7_9BACT
MHANRSLRLLFLTIFLDLMGYGLIIPLLPNYTRSLGASAAMVGVVTAAYSLTQFVFGPVLSSLSDRYGRRPVLLLTIALNVVAYLLFGWAQSLLLLIGSRLLAGLASANLSVAQAYIADSTPLEGRTKALGMIGAALGLGFIFGPPVGGAVKFYLGIEWVGYVAAGLAALNLALALIQLPESLPATRTGRPIRFFDASVLAAVGRSSQLSRLFTVYFLFTLAFAILTVTGALLWRDRFALNDAQIGYTFAGIGVITAVIQGGLLGKLVARFGERSLMLTGLFLMALSLATMPFIPALAFMPGEVALIILFAIGYGLVLPASTALVSRAFSLAEQGQILGQYQSVAALARIIGPVAGAALYGWNVGATYLIGGGIMLVSLLLAQGIGQSASVINPSTSA